MPRPYLLLDACIAINLAATDHLDHIAQTLTVTFVLAGQAAREVGYLRDVRDGELASTPIDLDQHRSSGNLEIIELASAEYPLYIELASIVDDGEAATIAAAVKRGIQLATDDRKARRLCEERHIPEPRRTLSLVHTYSDGVGLVHAEICDLLIKMRDRASFLPPRADPDRKWWDDHIGGA